MELTRECIRVWADFWAELITLKSVHDTLILLGTNTQIHTGTCTSRKKTNMHKLVPIVSK